jgi:hypothetical protein
MTIFTVRRADVKRDADTNQFSDHSIIPLQYTIYIDPLPSPSFSPFTSRPLADVLPTAAVEKIFSRFTAGRSVSSRCTKRTGILQCWAHGLTILYPPSERDGRDDVVWIIGTARASTIAAYLSTGTSLSTDNTNTMIKRPNTSPRFEPCCLGARRTTDDR